LSKNKVNKITKKNDPLLKSRGRV